MFGELRALIGFIPSFWGSMEMPLIVWNTNFQRVDDGCEMRPSES